VPYINLHNDPDDAKWVSETLVFNTNFNAANYQRILTVTEVTCRL